MPDSKDDRMADAQRRALDSLSSFLPGDEIGSGEEATDDGDWVTVGDAAEQSGLSTATVRQLYRSGAIASRRRNGATGPYLVVLDEVMAQVPEPSEEMDAAYWEDEAKRARAETAALRAELERLRVERDELQVAVDVLREKAARPQTRVPLSGPGPKLRAGTPSSSPAPAPTEEHEQDPIPAPAAAPGPGQPRTDRRSKPRAAPEDTVMPVREGRRRGLLKRRKD